MDKAKWAEEARRYEDMAKVSLADVYVCRSVLIPFIIEAK